MKYYTYEEHKIFCVESGIHSSEVWREVVRLDWLPEGIYHNPDQAFNPESKARKRERYSKPENKAKAKEYSKKRHSTPEYKTRKNEYNKRRYWKNKK